MQSISINNVLRAVADIGTYSKEGEGPHESVFYLRNKNILIRDTFLKLFNDKVFYKESKESGLLQEYLQWLSDVFFIGFTKEQMAEAKKKTSRGSSFLTRQQKWSDEQLFAFMTVMFSSDLYSKPLYLPSVKGSLPQVRTDEITPEKLIMKSMGIGNPRESIGRLDIGSLEQSGLKRIVIVLSEDEAVKIDKLTGVLKDRATALARMVDRYFKKMGRASGQCTIDYRVMKEDAELINAVHEVKLNYYNQNQDSVNILNDMVTAAMRPVFPDESSFLNDEITNSDKIIKEVNSSVNSVNKLKEYIDEESSVAGISSRFKLTTALNELNSVVSILEEVKKRS